MASTVSFANRSCRKYPSSATCRFARFVKRVFSFESAWAASGVFARCTRRHLFLQRRSRVCCPLNRRLQRALLARCACNAHFLSSRLSMLTSYARACQCFNILPGRFSVRRLRYFPPSGFCPSPFLSSLAFLLVACHLVNLAPERRFGTRFPAKASIWRILPSKAQFTPPKPCGGLLLAKLAKLATLAVVLREMTS